MNKDLKNEFCVLLWRIKWQMQDVLLYNRNRTRILLFATTRFLSVIMRSYVTCTHFEILGSDTHKQIHTFCFIEMQHLRNRAISKRNILVRKLLVEEECFPKDSYSLEKNPASLKFQKIYSNAIS